MQNVLTAALLTLLYWIATIGFALLAPRGTLIDIRWWIATYFFAIPTTLMLWGFLGISSYYRLEYPRGQVVILGTILPFAYAALAWFFFYSTSWR